MDDIRSALQAWSSSGISLAITTGGTGFSVRDVTPEAVRPLLAKEAYGLQHLMMTASLTKTPMAALSRPIAGLTKEGMIIVTVPGSPKGAKENVEALLKVLPHALDLARGGSGKEVHQAMSIPQRNATDIVEASQDANLHEHHQKTHSHIHLHDHNGSKSRTVRSADVTQGGKQSSFRYNKTNYVQRAEL